MVFVLSSDGQLLDPCHAARAPKLLEQGRASIWRHYPFTYQHCRVIQRADGYAYATRKEERASSAA